MQSRNISTERLAVSRIGLGCVTFGREIDETASFALLDHAMARGVTLFDTAAAYGGGVSEQILGRWLASRKPQGITVATKILPPYDRLDISSSLRRLGVERIDLLYLHQWHESVLHARGSLEALLREGKVRALGVSNVTAGQLREADDCFSVIQNNHNLAVRDVDDELRKWCSAHDIAIITYSPLGAGFLTGKHRFGVQPGSRFEIIPGHQAVYFHDIAFKRLERLESVAARSGIPQTRLALAWALHQPGVASVLVGGRLPAQLDEAFAALELGDPGLLTELETGAR